MSEIFEKDGNFFRACLFCGGDILIHAVSGNAYSMAIHNDPRTDIICFECAKKVGAA